MKPIVADIRSHEIHFDEFDLSFKVFHELMAQKVNDILLVSTPYDAFIMEEEGRLAERIIHEYRGLNLSRPPRLKWVSTAQEAIYHLSRKNFDLVITMPRLNDMDAFGLGRHIKEVFPELPVFLLADRTNRVYLDRNGADRGAIDKIFVWNGNADLLLALIKSREDRMNIEYDTERAKVRVIILVEDSPIYYSSLLPLFYKEIVTQTQAVMEDSLNDEHRILRMRARPKILLAENYEEAEYLYRQYRPYLLSVLSDVRFPRNGQLDDNAGVALLSMIKSQNPDLPLLNFSTDEHNRVQAEKIPAVFLNKNSPNLHREIRDFFINSLGFGDFIFRTPDNVEVARASNLREMEKVLPTVPDDAIYYHASRNHFSSWLMARSEILLATKLKPIKVTDFESMADLKRYLADIIHLRRKGRQKGVIAEYTSGEFDPDSDFIKIGKGSLGGKARGLAFMLTQLESDPDLKTEFKGIDIGVPKTLVISTDAFDEFIQDNQLKELLPSELSDARISERFLQASLPDWLCEDFRQYLSTADYPLAVRSSSLLEDAQFQPFAGIYQTYMLPNQHPDPALRLERLCQAVKLVYASTYFSAPRAYAQNTMHRIEEEKMAIVIQRLAGSIFGDFFYPAISGVARSYNYYPVGGMKPEEGIADIALGLGKTVVEGGTSLRFSPAHPQLLPQFSTIDDILKNAQRHFFALRVSDFPSDFGTGDNIADDATLSKLEIDEYADHPPVKHLSSAYFPQEHRIRDVFTGEGYPVMTFAAILKYRSFPLADILQHLLSLGKKGMGTPVEIEFSVDLSYGSDKPPRFALLQIRPMSVGQTRHDVSIEPADIDRSVCYSTMALGNGIIGDIRDIVYVRPETFDAVKTLEMAREIGQINSGLAKSARKYLLVGPGRWGSADRWLGIPVTWNDISGVGAIIETVTETLKADPSQGSHFFHNITALGISYWNIRDNGTDFIDWQWLNSLPVKKRTEHISHVQLAAPLILKIDGTASRAILLPPER